jgi:hypothetical protein
MGEHEGSDALNADGINVLQAFSLETEARRILEDIASNADFGTDERVLAWAKLKAWGHGREFACCHVTDLKKPGRADVIVPVVDELIVASQQQCADELDIPLHRVRAAASRLVKRGLLATPWVEGRSFVTKYKLGKGFRACLANKQVRAFCPVREAE